MAKKQTDGNLALEQQRVIVIPAHDEFVARKLRVAAYARVSSSSEDQLNSYRVQNQYYSALISGNPDWEMVDIYADDTDILGLKSELQQRSASLVQFLCAERRKTNEKRGEKTDGKWAGPVEGTARFNSRKP